MDSSFYNYKVEENNNNNYDLNLEFNFDLNVSSNLNISQNLSNIIDSNNSDYLDIKIEEDYFRSSLQINDDTINDYVVISANKCKKINMDYSNSNYYISKSLYFIKESYNFFSNYNSI